MKDVSDLAPILKRKAYALGFDDCRILPVEEAPHAGFFEAWIGADRAGEMTYLERFVEKRRRPALLATKGDQYRSLIVLSVDYYQFDLPAALQQDPARGIIASYAWGEDYHELIRPRIYELDEFLRRHSGRSRHARGLVDTGPVLERDWAHESGIGFTGKNCCTITPGRGSWLFLATLLVPEVLEPDPRPHTLGGPEPQSRAVFTGLEPEANVGSWSLPIELSDHSRDQAEKSERIGTCGQCTRCLDACPTDAFVGPLHLDPLRCISYWTIEARRAIPHELRSAFANRIFGCDICQEVCPWNRHLSERRVRIEGLAARDQWIAPPLLEGYEADLPYWRVEDAFADRFAASPVLRAGRDGMARNVAIALGNWGSLEALSGLQVGLEDDSILVREHAAWGVGEVMRRHPQSMARRLLTERLDREESSQVREEIRRALE